MRICGFFFVTFPPDFHFSQTTSSFANFTSSSCSCLLYEKIIKFLSGIVYINCGSIIYFQKLKIKIFYGSITSAYWEKSCRRLCDGGFIMSKKYVRRSSQYTPTGKSSTSSQSPTDRVENGNFRHVLERLRNLYMRRRVIFWLPMWKTTPQFTLYQCRSLVLGGPLDTEYSLSFFDN